MRNRGNGMQGKSTINMQQNDERILKYLFAQRILYAECKRRTYVGIILGIVLYIAGVLPIEVAYYKEGKMIVSILMTVVVGLMTYCNNQKRILAVDFKEYVDRQLYGMKIEKKVISNLNQLETEANKLVQRYPKKYKKQINPSESYKVYNWYSDVSNLPQDIGCIVCQYENCEWEQAQRIAYSMLLIGLVLIISLGMIIKKIVFHESIFMCIYCMPILVEIIKIMIQNYKTVKITKKVNAKLDEVFTYIVDKKKAGYSSRYLMNKVAQIQKYINAYRRNNIDVPDWFYRLKLKKQAYKTEQIQKLRIEEMLKILSTEGKNV